MGAVFLAFVLLLIIFYVADKPIKNPTWGLTFSQIHARYLGFNPSEMFDAVINDLHPDKVRLMAYWETIEATRGKYDFAELDELVHRAKQNGVEVMMVVGQKLPRWPECHHPAWYNDLSDAEKRAAQDTMITAVVSHYKNDPTITRWQVENEALFNFGEMCPSMTRQDLAAEVALVKRMDPNTPTLISDSGEFGRWLPSASAGADEFGSTMYRVVYNAKFGYFKYPLPPAFFKIKNGMLRIFTKYEKVSGVELQAEPWFSTDIELTPLTRQYELMNAKIFTDNVSYAKKSGFAEHYSWGVEWWYWLKQKHDDPTMWESAKYLFQTN